MQSKTTHTVRLPAEVEEKLAKVKLMDSVEADLEIDTSELEAIVNAEFLQSINSFDFDIFNLVEQVGRNKVLPCIGLGILQVNGLRASVDVEKYVSFT